MVTEMEDDVLVSENEDLTITDSAELESIFNTSFYLEREEAISLKKNYIVHLTANKVGSEASLGVAVSSFEVFVYSLGNTFTCSHTIPVESSPIINTRFAPNDPSLFYVGSAKGTVKLYDLRCLTKPAQQFTDTSNPKSTGLHEKTLCHFDINCSGRFLSAGTEVTDGDAYLMFWDTRNSSLLGGYWETHTDDVTQVVYHPSEEDTLVTGSTDGLINVYDVSQSDESEALTQSLNTESSVEKLRWHKDDVDGVNTVSCITHTADVQLWHVEDSSPFLSYSRADIASSLQVGKEKFEDNLYVTDVHSTSREGQLLVLAGSNFGNGRCFRSAITSSGKLKPHSNFTGNKQIVRCSWFDYEDELLVTGGEGGILSVWKAGTGQNTTPSQLKVTSKLKDKPHKKHSNPY